MDSFSDDEGLFEELNAGINKIRKEVIMDLESEESNEGCTMERMDNGYGHLCPSADGMAHAKAKRTKALSDAPLDPVTEEWALNSPSARSLGELSLTDDSKDVDVNNNPQVKSKAPFAWADLHLLVNGSLRTAEEPTLRARQEIRNHRSQNAGAVWEGILPPKEHRWPTYSPKVFLGGIPFGITQDELYEEFSAFGDVQIVWPKTRRFDFRHGHRAGHVYIIFDGHKHVKSLVMASKHNIQMDTFHYEMSTCRWATWKVQVVPWLVWDDHYEAQRSSDPSTRESVFVGGLHGLVNARALAKVMHDLFGGVVAADLVTDQYRYPRGSGRVTFTDHSSYVKAVTTAASLWIKTPEFTKKAQVEPYLEESACSSCKSCAGVIYCKDEACLRYFCGRCWDGNHRTEARRVHKRLTLPK